MNTNSKFCGYTRPRSRIVILRSPEGVVKYSPIDNSKKYEIVFCNSSPSVIIKFTQENKIYEEEQYFGFYILECYILDETDEPITRAIYCYNHNKEILHLEYKNIDNEKVKIEILSIYIYPKFCEVEDIVKSDPTKP